MNSKELLEKAKKYKGACYFYYYNDILIYKDGVQVGTAETVLSASLRFDGIKRLY